MGLFTSSGLQKDCDKSAQILQSFITKNKIPTSAITNAKGLAIFTAVRVGMYLAGSGGSGIVIARLPDGSWSPPSAFSVRSGSIGLVYGVDVYDCVCILNTEEAVEAYTKPEFNMGGAVALAAGPLGGTANSAEMKPVWTYTKSKGLYGGLTIDGTVIKEKSDVNTEFYGSAVTVSQILNGDVRNQEGDGKWPAGAKQLIEVLKLAEGRAADPKVLQEISTEPTAGDLTQ